MADIPISNYGDYYLDNNDTPDFSDISIDENDSNKGLDGNEIRNILVQMFPENLKDNTEIISSDDVFTIDHFKSFLQNISTKFNDLKKPKQQELQNQLQKLKKQLNEKEQKYIQEIENLQKQFQEKEQKSKKQLYEKEQEHTRQIKYLQETLKEGKKEIMKEIGVKIVDGNENIDLSVQLKDFIDYCKKEISARIEFIEELSKIIEREKKEFYKVEIEKLEQINNNLMEENEQLKRQSGTNQVKDEEIKKLKQENNDLIRQMNEKLNEKLNEKEKEIEEINVEKVKGSCEEEKVGEMIKTMTQRKLLTFTNELTKSRHSSQLSQQLILNSSSFIIPITIFEFYNGCTKMITIPINGNNILKEVIIDKCDNHLIKTINGKTIIIEVQQHNHITYDRKNEIAIFMIKRSEINQDIQIRHPCGNLMNIPKEGLDNLKYKGTDGTEIEIRIVDDNKFNEEMKRYYDIFNGVEQQKRATLEKMKENVTNKRTGARIQHNQQINPLEDIQPINQSRKIPINVIGKSIGMDVKATFYVSFIQSFVFNNNNVFDYNYELCKHDNNSRMFIRCEVKIPTNYNKDVYYWDYQNRYELFGHSQYDNIPVYFPIPVLKDKKQYTVMFYVSPYFHQKYIYYYIQLNVRIG
ncbi:hypothetical protein QTN25_004878 [Entamoeba marina]